MIGYGTRKIILKLPPFWITNEELQEREIQNQMKTKNKDFSSYYTRFIVWSNNYPNHSDRCWACKLGNCVAYVCG